MSSVLTVNGTAHDQTSRRAANYLIDGWGWDLEAGYWLEFHEHTSGPQPRIAGPCAVSLAVGGTTVFTGDLVGSMPAIDGTGRRTWGYRCLGLEYRAGWIPVTANDGSGLIRFNVSPTNADYYTQSMAGLTVGQILTYCFNSHATALTAAGITTDSTTTSEFDAQTLVPSSEVQIAGESLWGGLKAFLAQYARNLRLVITGAGLVRLVDITAGAAHTLTMGTDPIDPPMFSRNWTTSATQVTVRGRGVIEPGYVSAAKGTLTPAWTSTEQSSWTYSDFTSPNGPSTDSGTVTGVTSATTVTIQSSNAARSWAANYWNGIQAWVYLTNTSGTGTTYQEARQVTACTALTAGGTCTLTLAYALSNSASSAYNGYQLIGTDPTLASGSLYDVWRLYNVSDPGSLIANHLVPSFPVQVPFIGWNGESATLTSSPTCQIVGPNGAGPAQFYVLPNTGQVLFIRPVVEQLNSVSQLNSGTYTTPSDVFMLLAYSRGALTTSYPASGYGGTAYSQAGLQRTQTVDVYDWSYYGNSTVLNTYAQMLQVAVSNTLVEGPIQYRGLYTACQDPTGGHLMNVAGNGYTTGDESLNIPVRAYSVRYLTEGGGLTYATSLRCSTRQDPRTGASQYDHLSVLGSALRFGVGEGGGFGGGGPVFGGAAGLDLGGGGMGGGGMGTGMGLGWGVDRDQGDGGERRRSPRRTRLASRADRYQAAEDRGAIDRDERQNAELAARYHERHPDKHHAAKKSSGGLSAADRSAVDRDQRRNAELAARRDSARRAKALRVDPNLRPPPSPERLASAPDQGGRAAPPSPEQERSAPGQGGGGGEAGDTLAEGG